MHGIFLVIFQDFHDFQRLWEPCDKWYLNKGQKYCRMLPLEHSAILLTCIKLSSVLKVNFGILFEWPLKTGFTVLSFSMYCLTPSRALSPGVLCTPRVAG